MLQGSLKKPEVGSNVFSFVLPYEGMLLPRSLLMFIQGEWVLKVTRGKKQLFANEKITTKISKELPNVTLDYDFEISASKFILSEPRLMC